MKLIRVKVENFRSIEDTGEFPIDDLTCLVGKNEAGKTAVLQALHALRPFNPAKTSFDVTQEYPRRFVTKFAERHKDEQALVVSTWWKLTDEAKKKLEEEFGPGSVKSDELRISKYYNDDGTRWSVPIDEAQAVKNIISQSQLNAAERSTIGEVTTTKALTVALQGIAQKTEKHTALLNRLSKYREGSILKHGIDLIDDLVPKFFYASHYDRMSGQISVNKLATDRQQNRVDVGDKIFLDFLELSGTSLQELQSAKKYEDLIAKCEAASNEITEQIFNYWKQNDALEVKLDFSEARAGDPAPFNSGTIVRARVWNTLHRASVPFSERSAGFVWFFSFLVQFAAMRNEAGNAIILLDEPGLTLHGKAQADLLEYIEKELLPHHQVIFSTHSPFMVPPDRLTSIRIVEDVVDRSKSRPDIKGTKVRNDILATNQDTLFPLQAALGYDLTQSLLVGKHTLLVEGPSDLLYLQALSAVLKKNKRTGLDPRWTICPTGGIGNVRSFVSLFGGNHLDIAVLADHAKGDGKKIEDLRRSAILKTGRIFTAAEFTNKGEADIEDLFEPALFAEIVNAAYYLPPAQRLTADILVKADPNTERQVKQVEAAFRVFPDAIPAYDHFTPSYWLLENLNILDPKKPEETATLDRAEKLFQTLNALLAA